MTKELVLSTKDLTDVGITSQLSSNDLLEVVAHDIFEKFMDEVNDCVSAEKKLHDKLYAVMQPEQEDMKAELIKAKMLLPNELVNTGFSSTTGGRWINGIHAKGLDVSEKDRGTKVEKDGDAIWFSYPVGKEVKVKLTISNSENDNEVKNNIGSIKCVVNTNTQKHFEKVVTISASRFRTLIDEIKQHNERIDQVCEALPKNGVLSVERFTREARVKMNKKIISAQSPDFRKKISQLFNISL